MDGLTEAQVERLTKDNNIGKIIRAFCQHPGFKIYQSALNDIIEDKKKRWLQGTEDEARLERIRAQGVEKALSVLKQFILIGDNSARILDGNVPEITK